MVKSQDQCVRECVIAVMGEAEAKFARQNITEKQMDEVVASMMELYTAGEWSIKSEKERARPEAYARGCC